MNEALALMRLKALDKKRIHNWLPWYFVLPPHLNPTQDTIATRSGGLLRVARLDGLPDMESAGSHAMASYYRTLTTIISSFGRGWTLKFDQWRVPDDSYLPRCDFGGIAAAEEIDEERRRLFSDPAHPSFRAVTFLSISLKPQQREKILGWLSGRRTSGMSGAVEFFFNNSEALFGKLIHRIPGLTVLSGDELASYLESTVSFRPGRVEMPPPGSILCKQLATQDWFTNPGLRIGRNLYVATVEVRNFGATNPLTCEPLQRLPFPTRHVMTYYGMTKEDRLEELTQLEKRWRIKLYGGKAIAFMPKGGLQHAKPNEEAAKALADLSRIRGNLDKEPFGGATVNIHVIGRTRQEADERAGQIANIYTGPKAEMATLNAFYAPMADMPGNDDDPKTWNVRRNNVRIAAALRFAPVTGVYTGHKDDVRFNGPALTVGMTRRRHKIYIPLNSPGSDVGHSLLIGRTGAGKSAALAFFASQALRYKNSRVVILDRKRSSRIMVLAHGGSWVELGAGGIGVQPLRHIDRQEEFNWASRWVLAALEVEGVTRENTPGLTEDIADAMRSLLSLDPDDRTLTALWSHLSPNPKAASALNVYRAGQGPYGSLFDGVVRSYGESRVVGIETYDIMDSEEGAGSTMAALTVAALCHAVKREAMTGRHPTLLIGDEASFLLTHKFFGKWFQEFILEARKDMTAVLLATQSIEHFDNQNGSVIMQQAANVIYLPDSKITEPDIAKLYEKRGIGRELREHIADGTPKKEYFFKTDRFAKMLDFTLTGTALAVCGASSKADHLRADHILSEGFKPGNEFYRAWMSETTAQWAERVGLDEKRLAA